MNILHIRASNFYGGPERQLHLHARMARPTRYRVIIGSFTELNMPPEFLEIISRDGLATQVFEVTGAYDPSAIRKVRNYLKSAEINILCTHDYRSHLVGFLASRRLPVRWVAFSRGWTQDNWTVRAYYGVEKALVRFADVVIAVSHAQKARLRRYLVPQRKIEVVQNAIDTGALEGIPAEDLRARYGFPQDTVLAVSAGRFSREKGQSLLVEAGELAVRRDPRLRIIMFGAGPDLEMIRHAIRQRHCDAYILCPGFERNVLSCIKGADLLVNSSRSEGLPNIVLEAMALGVPVVATAVGGVPELIIDGLTGKLVRPESPADLAAAILDLAHQSDVRTQQAHVALNKVRDEFSFEGQMAQLASVYDRAYRP